MYDLVIFYRTYSPRSTSIDNAEQLARFISKASADPECIGYMVLLKAKCPFEARPSAAAIDAIPTPMSGQNEALSAQTRS